MKTIKNLALFLALAAAGVATTGLFVGCAKEKNDKTATGNGADTDAALKALPEKQRKALMELSPEDRKLALEQKSCLVEGGPLGAMGKPIKVEVKGQTVFVCCKVCVDAVKKEPDKYLEKLKK